MKKISVNQFNKGLNLDNNPVSVSNDSLIGALNATFITKNGNEVVLQNDMGNASVDKAQLPAGYVPLGAKEHGGIIYVASYNPLTDESQIGCFPSPQRNFANSSECNLGFDSLYDFVGHGEPATLPNHYYINKPYEQRIITIDGTDGIIRPGDKFVITSTGCGDFITYKDLLKVRVLIITSDNQSIDITDELTHPRINFGDGLEFIRDIFTNTTIEDSDYTIYTNRTCGQLCLKAELILPYRIELSYNATYDQNTDITDLYVHFTAYDKEGNLFQNNQITYYQEQADIEGGGSLNLYSDGNVEKHYRITGATDDTTIKVKYYPQFTVCNNTTSSCHTAIISSIKIEDEIQLSLIGSGRVTFNTFRYFNDFDNNHLVFNYGLKFYNGDSQYKLTDLYLELINLRDLDAVSWNYDNVNLNKKKIALNTDNAYGVYTEIIDYLTTQQTNILSSNDIPVTELSVGGENKILVGQYYLARICAQVDGTTLHKGDWHALLTSEATNYIYTQGEEDMLNLQKEDAIEYVDNQDPYNTNDPNNKILLNYTLNDTNEIIDNYEERLSGNCDNYFSDSYPQNSELRFEIEKSSSETTFKHSATSSLIIPRSFPFSQSEINYNPTVIPDIEKVNQHAFVQYQDNIEIRRGNNYTTNGTIEHYDTSIIEDGQKIGGNSSLIRNGKNEIQFNFAPAGMWCNININYKLYSQLFTPFEIENNVYKRRTYNGQGLVFKPYIESNDDLATLLNQQSVIETSNKIYPERKLYCIYEHRSTPPVVGTAASIGLVNYGINSSTDSDPIRANDIDLFNLHPAGRIANSVNIDIYPYDPTISTFINDNANNPNIYIFSSCINEDSSNIKSDSLLDGNNMITEYDMILLRGDDDKMYLLGDIETTKGILLNKFKSCFSKIYVPKDNQPITLNYYRGNKNNYFTTNDYKITISYNINYQNTSNININNYNPNIVQTLDFSYIRLPNIKFNENIITKHFNQIIRPISIDEQVINFLENSSDDITLGNIALVDGPSGEQFVYYAKHLDNDNHHESFNIGDSYIKLSDSNYDLYNCRNVNLDPNSQLYNIVNAIKNNYIKQNSNFDFVLNVGNIPNNQLPFRFGYKEYPLRNIFAFNTRNIKLFT